MYKIRKIDCQDVEPWLRPFSDRIIELNKDLNSNCKIALQLYDRPDTSTFRYLCYNAYQHTRQSNEWKTHYFYECECEEIEKYIDKISILILCRTKWSLKYKRVIDKAKRIKIPVLLQIDDYVCDDDYVTHLLETTGADVSSLDNSTYDYWFSYIGRIQYVARIVDGFLVTNEYLGEMIKAKYNKPYAVIHNNLNYEQASVSEKYFEQKRRLRKGARFTIGYFSGSPSHKYDFWMIASEINRLMEEFENIDLYVVGFMEFPEYLKKFIDEERIHFEPLVDFIELQYHTSLVDVNIVPLVDNEFTNCKSELKFFEAAVVGTVTCAAPIFTYKSCIENGKDGFLCSQGEWYETIKNIYLNQYDIDKITIDARKKALELYYGPKIVEEIEHAYNNMLTIKKQ